LFTSRFSSRFFLLTNLEFFQGFKRLLHRDL